MFDGALQKAAVSSLTERSTKLIDEGFIEVQYMHSSFLWCWQCTIFSKLVDKAFVEIIRTFIGIVPHFCKLTDEAFIEVRTCIVL